MLKPALLCTLLSLTIVVDGAEDKKDECVPSHRILRASAQHIEAGGVGYSKGYSSLDLFFAGSPDWRVMPFLDIRGHVFNDAKYAVNGGIGFRSLGNCRVYGMNAYWDYRNTHRFHYNQVGVGLETLGVRWDFRINGYLPIFRKTSPRFRNQETTTYAFDAFNGNQAILKQSTTTTSRQEFAMKGGDAEIAFHILKNKNFDLYPAVGPYYYQYKNKHAIGGRVRLCAQIYDYLSLEVSNTYDNMFHDRFQGRIGINIPFGPKINAAKSPRYSQCDDGYYVCQRMLQDVNRQEIIVVNQRHRNDAGNDLLVAINPATGLPYNFFFVDNTSHSTGTYESPFNTLLAAQMRTSPGDIIYVFPGDGTTTGMNSGIILQNNQNFWGSGVSHTIQTTVGTIAIPSQTATYPQMTNSTGNAITLANGNDVSGFYIPKAQGHGVFGSNVTNDSLSYLTIFGALDDGIHLDESIDANLAFDQLLVTNCTLNGLNVVASSAATVNVSVTNNEFALMGQNSQGRGIVLASSDTATFAANIANNHMDNNLGAAIDISSTSNSTVPLAFNISGNVMEGMLSEAVTAHNTGNAGVNINLASNQLLGNKGDTNGVASFIFGNAGASNLVATNNVFKGNFSDSFHIIAGANGTFAGSMQNNQILGNVGSGLTLINAGVNSVNMNVENNTMSGNCSNGLAFSSSVANSLLNLAISDNFIDGNCGDAVGIQNFSTGNAYQELNVSLAGNTLSSNAGSGVNINSPITDTLQITAQNNAVNGNCGNGISIGGTINNFNSNISNNTIFGNCGEGIVYFGTPTNSFNLAVSSNTISGQFGNGINLNTSNAPTNVITIADNRVSDNSSDGILITSSPTDDHTVAVTISGNTIDHQNTGQGIHIVFNGSSTATSSYSILENTINYNNQDGILVSVTNGGAAAIIQTIVENNTLSFNRNNGMALMGNTTESVQLVSTFQSNIFENNNLSGLNLTSQANSQSVVTVASNTFANNNPFLTANNDALFFKNSSSGASICTTLTGNTNDANYSLVQTAGTFNAPQTLAEVTAENTGTVSTIGTVNFNTPCP